LPPGLLAEAPLKHPQPRLAKAAGSGGVAAN
jgi:hypothetical protein